jgi:hypothetical protein
MSWLPPYLEPSEEVGVLQHLRDESDRAVGIIAGSALESALLHAIQRRLHNHPVALKSLFRPSGPLGPFSNKIDLGYVMGVYGKKTYRDLITIKDIRNTFAHDLSINSFSDQKIKALCANLVLVESHTKERPLHPKGFRTGFPIWLEGRDEWLQSPRKRYVVAVLAFCMLLNWAKYNFDTPKPPEPPQYDLL